MGSGCVPPTDQALPLQLRRTPRQGKAKLSKCNIREPFLPNYQYIDACIYIYIYLSSFFSGNVPTCWPCPGVFKLGIRDACIALQSLIGLDVFFIIPTSSSFSIGLYLMFQLLTVAGLCVVSRPLVASCRQQPKCGLHTRAGNSGIYDCMVRVHNT